MEKIQPQGATEDAVAKETKRKGCREAGRREDMGRGTIINMNKGLDARMGDMSS